jgi:hypothetical protein
VAKPNCSAFDPAATLATEMQILHEDLPTLNALDPLEVPLEREQYELSVEADRYTLATRRAFVKFMRDAARPATGSSTSDEPSESVMSAAGERPG